MIHAAGLGALLVMIGAAAMAAPLEVKWQRSFPCNVPIGDQESEGNNELDLAAGKGSFNLAAHGDHLALVAADVEESPRNEILDYYLTVLDASSGETENVIQIIGSKGNQRVYHHPYNTVSMATDTPTGLLPIYWDRDTGILFTGQSGYNTAYTAYLPLTNTAAFESGQAQPGAPAYTVHADAFPDYADSFGRTRAEQISRFGVAKDRRAGLVPEVWGPSGSYVGEDPEARFDLDYNEEKDNRPQPGEGAGLGMGLSFYNLPSMPHSGPGSPVIGLINGDGVGHNTAGKPMLYHKQTGMKAMAALPDFPPITFEGKQLESRPFTHDGMKMLGDRIYFVGPSEDRTGNGQLGTDRVYQRLDILDQGLALWAVEIEMEDRQPNGGAAGEIAAETVTMKPLFHYTLPSRFETKPGDFANGAQSYYEGDGFYRPKPFLVDEEGIWFAWKPNREDPVELVRADANEVKAYPLGVGKGLMGVDLWPALEMSTGNEGSRLVYFAGVGEHRVRSVPEDPEAELARHFASTGKDWDGLPAKEKTKLADAAKRSGIWSLDSKPPRGPAEIAVFEPESGSIAWTYDISAHHPSFPVNGFWSSANESHLAVRDHTALVAWVDASKPDGEAELVVLSFDTQAEKPNPQVQRFPLGFSGAGNAKSWLTDLIEHEGRLFALVTQSDRFGMRDPRWAAQHVVALE